MFRPQLCAPSLPSPEPFQLTAAFARSPCLCHSSAALSHAQVSMCACLSPCEPKFSDLNGSACSFDVLVQLSRQLRPIRCPIVPSSVRVSQNFLTQMDAALGVLLCSSSSGISVPRSCTLRSQFVPASQPSAPKISCPSGCRFSNRLLPGCSDIPQQRSLTFRSPVLPASVCASQNFRAKWMPLRNCNLHFPMRCFGLLALPF